MCRNRWIGFTTRTSDGVFPRVTFTNGGGHVEDSTIENQKMAKWPNCLFNREQTKMGHQCADKNTAKGGGSSFLRAWAYFPESQVPNRAWVILCQRFHAWHSSSIIHWLELILISRNWIFMAWVNCAVLGRYRTVGVFLISFCVYGHRPSKAALHFLLQGLTRILHLEVCWLKASLFMLQDECHARFYKL